MLLPDAMLAAATERISDVSVTPSNDPGVHGQNVHVSYRLSGESISATVVLEEGEPEWGVLRTWRMREPFSQPADIERNNLSAAFTVGGVKDVGNNQLLFPAVYPVAAVESTYFELEESELVIRGVGDSPQHTITFKPTAALTTEVQRQVNAEVDACAASLSTSYTRSPSGDERCSLTAVMPQAGIAVGTWTVTTYPVVEFLKGGWFYGATTGNAQFTSAGGGAASDMLGDLERSGEVDVVDGEVRLGGLGEE